MPVPAYRLREVCVDRGARRVLDISLLEITAGKVTAIVGPNGAGKTTLLRVLALLEPTSAGMLEFQGERVASNAVRDFRRQVTLVSQAPLLFRRTVRANVAYGLQVRRRTSAERIAAALCTVGLADLADRPAWKLSGGEAQRIAIARALAIDTPVVLFDEPTASVDRQQVPVIESIIAALGRSGRTVVLTTHNLEQAYRLGDALVALLDGRLTRFPLVNLLRGRTELVDGSRYFLSEGVRVEIPAGAPALSIAIDPEDIIVSRQPLQSSARNSWPGRIARAEHDDRGVLLTVDCGRPLIARITLHSYQEMQLNVGLPVYATFKSSAVHIVESEET